MAVSTMTAPEVEPRQRLTKWLIGAASVVMLAGLLFDRSSHSPRLKRWHSNGNDIPGSRHRCGHRRHWHQGAPVDLDAGAFAAERIRIPTHSRRRPTPWPRS
jgi:hypothetical protein